MSSFKLVSIFLIFLASTQVLAWGGRGHAAICEAAVFLVKEEGLKEYLQNKPQIMSHLCNIPDTHWRSIGAEANKLGAPTHFIDVEVIGLKVKDIPADYKKIIATFTGKPNQFKESSSIFSVPEEFGSSWWRADQFYRRALNSAQNLKNSEAPKNSKEEQDENLPYNLAAYDMMINMGLMGHFVGDNSQPLHNTTDYDGYAANHGGIHAYYEDTAVSFFDGDLTAQVLKKARSKKKNPFEAASSTIERMRILSELSTNEIREIWKLDPVTRPSSIKVEKGVSFKTPAERAGGKVGWTKFNKLIVEQLSRSAILLAMSWDEIYVSAGRPKITAYKSYKYPFTPDFVPPDYFDIKAAPSK